MIVSMHQPTFWPWLGLLDKIAMSDLFIILDHVQMSKGSYQYRNVFFCGGDRKFLTLPINYHLGDNFHQLSFRSAEWQVKQLSQIQNYYLRSPFFSDIYPLMESYYNSTYETPLEAIARSMQLSMELFSIDTKIGFSSEYRISSDKGEMVFDLCKVVDASVYLSGKGAYAYMQDVKERFKAASITIDWQDFTHPIYPQAKEYPFVEGLAGIDLLFWNGIDRAREIFWDNVKRSNKSPTKV